MATDRFHLRRLAPGEEASLDAFLAGHAESSVFLRANLRAAGLADSGALYQATYAGAFEGERLLGVVAHCWNGNMLLQAPVAAGELAVAARGWSGRGLAALIGPWAHVAAARRALGAEARPTRLDSKEALYRLALDRLAVPAPLADGRLACRRSRNDDLPRLLAWGAGYASDLLGGKADPVHRQEQQDLLRQQHATGNLFVLESQEAPVAMAGFNATLPTMVQVGGVYTPPELRRRGHGRAVVAGALLAARAAGVETAALFTGERNRAARRAYEALGFAPAGDYGLVVFAAEPPAP